MAFRFHSLVKMGGSRAQCEDASLALYRVNGPNVLQVREQSYEEFDHRGLRSSVHLLSEPVQRSGAHFGGV